MGCRGRWSGWGRFLVGPGGQFVVAGHEAADDAVAALVEVGYELRSGPVGEGVVIDQGGR